MPLEDSFGPIYPKGSPTVGIGGYDLADPADRVFPFDYRKTGIADHLVLYRPGTGLIRILRNAAGTFKAEYQSSRGIGGYKLRNPADRAFGFDYDGTSRADHLVVYEPGGAGGIGGYNLTEPADRAFAFDYNSSGSLDHLVLYRPGTGRISIVKRNGEEFDEAFSADDGIGDYTLKSPADRAFAFDYNSSGRLDHLVLYRPGTGVIRILKRAPNGFDAVYQDFPGIGGFALDNPADRAFAFDYNSSGRLDHLVLYRPGTGLIRIVGHGAGAFDAVDEGATGIGGYRLDSPADRAFAFDYNGSGRADHLAFYRPGTGTIWILRRGLTPRYGGLNLQPGDHDRNAAGTARYEGTARGVDPGALAHVAALQQDLVELGFAMIALPADGILGPNTEWAVREFQIHAGLPQAAVLPSGPGMGIPNHTAMAIPESERFTGPISGVADQRTRDLIGLWVERRWRCPVVVRAVRGGVVTDNVWRATEAPGPGTVYSVRDLSGAYPLPPDRLETAFHPLARRVPYVHTYRNGQMREYGGGQTRAPIFGGPTGAVNRQVWAGAELLPSAVRDDATERTLDVAERSTFKVVRAVSEVECGGFLDCQNSYDRAFLSVGTFHWIIALASLGVPDDGELPALFAFAHYAESVAYRRAIERYGVRPDLDWIADDGRPSGERMLRRDWKYVSWLRKWVAGVDDWTRMPLSDDEAERFRGWHWFYRLAMAARTYPEWRRVLYDFARLRLRDLGMLPWGTALRGNLPAINLSDGTSRPVRLGDVFTSERSWAALARVHVNLPALVASNARASNALHNAVAATGLAGGGPGAWTNEQERAVLQAWIARVPAGAPRTSTEQARDWPARWRSPQYAFNLDLHALAPAAPPPIGPVPAVPAAGGLLSAARGSFVLDTARLPPAPDYSRATP